MSLGSTPAISYRRSPFSYSSLERRTSPACCSPRACASCLRVTGENPPVDNETRVPPSLFDEYLIGRCQRRVYTYIDGWIFHLQDYAAPIDVCFMRDEAAIYEMLRIKGERPDICAFQREMTEGDGGGEGVCVCPPAPKFRSSNLPTSKSGEEKEKN